MYLLKWHKCTDQSYPNVTFQWTDIIYIVTLSTNIRNLPNSKWDQQNPSLISGKQTIEEFKVSEIQTHVYKHKTAF